MAQYTIKRGDTAPPLTATLTSVTGAPQNLLDATVTFRMRRRGETVASLTRLAEIVDAAAGRVSLTWQPGDTSVAGRYEAEFVVAFSNGDTQTFPSGDFAGVLITENIPEQP